MDEATAGRSGRVNSVVSIGAIVTIVTVILALAGIYLPGMDPEVSFLFVIPAFAMLIFFVVLFDEMALSIELAQSLDLSIKNRSSVGQAVKTIVLLSSIAIVIVAWSVLQSGPPFPLDAAHALLFIFPWSLCILYVEMEFTHFKTNRHQI